MNDDVCGIETQDDWVELSQEMWDIRSVNKSYDDNLVPLDIWETLLKFQ